MSGHRPDKVGWYWNRLRAMPAAELIYRLRTFGRAFLERLGLTGARRVPPPNLTGANPPFFEVELDVDPLPYQRAADEMAAGRLPLFALQPAELGDPPRWNRDPLTGTEAPLAFGKTLDYRDPDRVGSIKYLWEPNRHLHLVTLAQAWRLTGEERYLDAISRHLNSWLEGCPYPRGPNWTSSLELAIRLINWSFTWHLLGGLDAPPFDGGSGLALRDRWLESVYRHCDFIARHYSRHSSANNHLIGEASGLLVATITWPNWDQTSQWRDSAFSELSREALAQNAPDGVNREQSTAYHMFVLDFLLIAGLAARSEGFDFPDEYWRRIESMLDYLNAVMDVRGNVPMIGDADDGQVVRLTPDPGFSSGRSLLATGAVLFERGDFKAKAADLDEKTLWLLGSEARRRFAALEVPEKAGLAVRTFPVGGYYVLGSRFETEDEIRLVADAGPLGYLSLAAHGHADALAFTLSVAGREVLIDPGTYAYHAQERWRDYFRGTAAHNTVRVDGLDQSVIGGAFLWTRHAHARAEVWEPGAETDRFVGVHDGYTRLEDPVVHRREILLIKPERRILITDTLECDGVHDVELFLHFAEDVHVAGRDDGSLEAEGHDVGIRIRLHNPALERTLYRGDDARPAGWISRRFDVKVPTTTAVWQARIDGTTRIVSEILCGSAEAKGRPS